MTIDQVVKLVFDSGGTLGLAIFAIWMLNRTWEGRLADAKDHAAEYKDLAERVTSSLKEATIVMAQLTERLRVPASAPHPPIL